MPESITPPDVGWVPQGFYAQEKENITKSRENDDLQTRPRGDLEIRTSRIEPSRRKHKHFA